MTEGITFFMALMQLCKQEVCVSGQDSYLGFSNTFTLPKLYLLMIPANKQFVRGIPLEFGIFGSGGGLQTQLFGQLFKPLLRPFVISFHAPVTYISPDEVSF